jgi:threonine synthase
MDISKASNFERFIFDLLARDANQTAQLFGTAVAQEGGFTLSPALRERAAGHGFVSGKSTHADRLRTIRHAWAQWQAVIDPHTADGLKVALEHLEPGVSMVVLETALPVKFAGTIVEALGREPDRPAALKDIEQLPKRFEVMPVDVAAVQQFIRAHVQVSAS